MAEEEIIKHTKAAINLAKDRTRSWKDKAGEILEEILIIVFAVSISIWFHNWSESRKERSQEKDFFIGLRKDLQADLLEMKGDQEGNLRSLQGIRYFEGISGGQPLNRDSLVADQWIFFSYTQINPRISRYEALKGSGKLDIIENKDLLLNITDLYQKDFPRIIRQNDYFNSLKDNRIFPFISDQLHLDAKGNGTNFEALLRSSKMHMLIYSCEAIKNSIAAYSDGIAKINLVIRQIDNELK